MARAATVLTHADRALALSECLVLMLWRLLTGGVVASAERIGVGQLLDVVADSNDKQSPEVARVCLGAKQITRARSIDLPGHFQCGQKSTPADSIDGKKFYLGKFKSSLRCLTIKDWVALESRNLCHTSVSWYMSTQTAS
jgi:hypothetical protein